MILFLSLPLKMSTTFSWIVFLMVLLWILRRSRRPPHYIVETLQYFRSSPTSWLTSQQLDMFQTCKQYACYVQHIRQMDSPALIKNMLIGQPLKYIWRDQNKTELRRYLCELKRANLDYQKSIISHSELYTREIHPWKKGTMIVLRSLVNT